jgi:putative transposase
VKATIPGVSERRLCRVLAIARTWARRASGSRRRRPVVNETLATRVAELIQSYPTFGYRRLWALLRFRDGQRLTRKTVYRLCALQG